MFRPRAAAEMGRGFNVERPRRISDFSRGVVGATFFSRRLIGGTASAAVCVLEPPQ